MKKILSLVLALVMVLTLLPVMPLRAEAATGGKLVALTFDDGPSSIYTPQLLDGLKERGVPVTFFILGEMGVKNRAIVRRAYEEGHEIACHTWSHPNLTECSESKVKKEIGDTCKELDLACGSGADYLVRPPYGSTNQKVRDAIDAPLIYWSVDSEDWSLKNVTKVRQKIVADTYDGAIILCHDIHKTTIPAALGAIDDLMAKGYEFVTVSELFRRRGRELEDHKLHYNSNKNGIDYGAIPAPKITFTGDPKGVNTVTLSCSDSKVPLYYTLDGSYPNQTATRYTGPFTVPYGTTVTAVAAYKLNGSRSALTVKTADKISVVAPTITLDASGDVVMTTPTVNSKIHFTVDNTKPTGSSLLYTGPEAISGGCFLRAVTVHAKGTSAEAKAYLSDNGDLYYDMYAGQWFYNAMDWAYRNKIVSGTAPYTMEPGGIVTRGMMVTLLYRFSGDKLEDGWEQTSAFRDVSRDQYYAKAVEWAYRNKIVSGYSNEEFGPNGVVTRQEMCRIVDGFLTWKGTPLRRGESCEGLFGDYDKVAAWALDSVEAMVSAGLLFGSEGDLKPNDSSDRSQVCVVLTRVDKYMQNYVPEEPEPSEPEHSHEWKMNTAQDGSTNWGSLTIHEGEFFELQIECTTCGEVAQVEWIADPDGVVLVDENVITGLLGGYSTLVRTVWEEVEYECLVYVRAVEDPTEPEPSDPTEPSEPEPSDPTEPTESQPTEPTEPPHVHSWKLNKQRGDDPTWGEVSIDVGESFKLRIVCTGTGCKEEPTVEWTADPDDVVSVSGNVITGLLAGKNTRVRAKWEGVTYECLIHVRKDTTVTEPTEPEPSEPEPTEPAHTHSWKLNKQRGDDPTWGEVSIDVGESFKLRIVCTGTGCKEEPTVEWTADPDGVVSVDGNVITGLLSGKNTRVRAQWEGVTYECLIHVRKDTTVTEPTEPAHTHSWKLNKARGDDPTWGEVSIDVGESFKLRIYCTDVECQEQPDVEWTADPDGVVLVSDDEITGLLAGKNARVRAKWEDVTFECLIHVRKEETPTEPEPSEPDHEHIWKMNKSSSDSLTKGDVSINVGETFTLCILCRHTGCDELAPITWKPSVTGVVSINGMRITGVKAGVNTTLSAQWEGETYSCIVRVRKQTTNSLRLVCMD